MESQNQNRLRLTVAMISRLTGSLLQVAFILLMLYPTSSFGQTFDPLGRSLFPQGRGVAAPQGGTINSLGIAPLQRGQSYQGPQIQPRIQPPATRLNPFRNPRINPQRQNIIQPSSYPISPAFNRAPRAPLCGGSNCANPNCPDCKNSQPKKRHFIPRVDGYKTSGQSGQLLMTPSRIVAPVGSEVVVLAGICGPDGYLVKNQPLEWMLSNDSVGQIIEVGGMQHPLFNKVVSPNAKKFDGQYAWGRTGLKPIVLTRGTPTPVDDIQLLKGQTFLSLSSESPGTTYLTGVAPAAEGWDRRRASTRIHWVDGNWSIPAPISTTAGTVTALSTVVSKSDGSGGVEGWKVRYSIVGGAPAEFAPAGSQMAEATTNDRGEAIVQIRQRAGQFEPGATQVRVDVVRPAFGKEPELVVESGLTQVTWSAPALTIRAIGPAESGADQPFNYRVEVSNPGDQVARGVVVSTKDFDPSIEYLSSSPKPTQYGNQYQWELGDIAPGSQPRVIDIQLKSKKRGTVGICFEVASASDRLRTEACAQTEVTGACIGLEIEGPQTVRIGDEMVFNLAVVNQCDEPLRNVLLRLTPDAGLIAVGTRTRVVQTEIDELGFGERRELQVGLQAVDVGRQCFRVDVVADGGHDASLLECVAVTQEGSSGIRLQLQGGAPVRVGDLTLVKAVVTNTGNVPLNSVAIEASFSSSLEPIQAEGIRSPEITLESNEPLLLELGRIEPGDSSVVDITYRAQAENPNAKLLFAVTSAESVSDRDEISIRVEPRQQNDNRGIDPTRPDFEDPPRDPQRGTGGGDEGTPRIPDDNQPFSSAQQRRLSVSFDKNGAGAISVGQANEAPIRFTVTNDDSFVHENVKVSMTLPDGLTYSRFDAQNSNTRIVSSAFGGVRKIDFAQELQLRPGQSITGTVLVTGRNPGSHQVSVYAGSDQSAVSVQSDEVVVIE